MQHRGLAEEPVPEGHLQEPRRPGQLLPGPRLLHVSVASLCSLAAVVHKSIKIKRTNKQKLRMIETLILKGLPKYCLVKMDKIGFKNKLLDTVNYPHGVDVDITDDSIGYFSVKMLLFVFLYIILHLPAL